ncbi:uncharacterized mitochondrial protein AtMg00810-like [Amaranthus tricolor]|uniref:uncharacterized mitochondrial protein AtMg00810-like n=1 Tax=Amaranthus tricolor TaxID=29722 RepID=UPI002587A8FD|nr:uncharacterized mitochondrial protein AtMg00810-like [Amaranthus tricolor]
MNKEIQAVVDNQTWAVVNLPKRKKDINFLYGDLHEEVYMIMLEGIPNPHNQNVDDHITILAVYVDDILITRSSEQEITAIKQHLHSSFTINDIGALHYFLGIESHWQTQFLDTYTRLDLLYVIHTLIQFMQAPRVLLWDALKYILNNIHYTCGQGIILQWNIKLSFWKSMKQKTISRSSSKAEYRVIANAASEVNYFVITNSMFVLDD